MAWSQVSPRRWERRIDGLDGFCAHIASVSASLYNGQHHLTTFNKLQLELNMPAADLEASLKRAWIQLRSTFIVSVATDGDELHPTVPPIAQTTLYYLPTTSELILRAPHHLLDGTGIMRLWDRFLGILVSPPEATKITFPDEPSWLPPSLSEVLGVPDEPTPEQRAMIMEMFRPYQEHGPGIGPISNLGSRPAGYCRHAKLVVPPHITQAIIQACKAKGISVSSAIQAAYIQTIKQHADPNHPSSHYITTAQFNVRPYLPPQAAQHAASLYLI
ncbi:uncharacterized protein BO80DRAFT_433447 [Aspergillus ibericus CBS 121593]|uniref:CoA-dependent acyltransferase n=1 Tax=Aspergillus ibericus CBS 121593 TaxID=1448316 RepID=A0A395H563_9EURO|nr:hypothetical protein BO80DRAFT_433447 [Aspergillus ibericus CBS 121593]RAL02639.1 hypothetical protein BO80DRAFT_433447 [Aspergillus ibericus CBS 121593]